LLLGSLLLDLSVNDRQGYVGGLLKHHGLDAPAKVQFHGDLVPNEMAL